MDELMGCLWHDDNSNFALVFIAFCNNAGELQSGSLYVSCGHAGGFYYTGIHKRYTRASR